MCGRRPLDERLDASSVERDAVVGWIRSQMINSGATKAEVAHLDTLREAVDMARWKFGEETAHRLAELIEAVGDTDRVSRIGRLLVECETGEDLIAKAAQI